MHCRLPETAVCRRLVRVLWTASGVEVIQRFQQSRRRLKAWQWCCQRYCCRCHGALFPILRRQPTIRCKTTGNLYLRHIFQPSEYNTPVLLIATMYLSHNMYMHWLRLPAKLASRVRVRVSMPACLSSVASSRHLTYPWRLNAAVSIVRFCAILRAGRRGRVTHSASTRRQQLSARRGPQDLKQPQKQHLVNQIKHIYST